ncbi:MAG: hypothetical protein GX607_16905 [Myxococcales bacterium]|nr:hypothetical protein [Myxococcales bacterium]
MISFVIVAGMDVLEEIVADEPNLAHLGVTLGSDATKLAISMVAGALASAVVVAAAGTFTLPVVVVAGAGLLGALVVGVGLDALDEHVGVTVWLQQRAMELEVEVVESVPRPSTSAGDTIRPPGLPDIPPAPPAERQELWRRSRRTSCGRKGTRR